MPKMDQPRILGLPCEGNLVAQQLPGAELSCKAQHAMQNSDKWNACITAMIMLS